MKSKVAESRLKKLLMIWLMTAMIFGINSCDNSSQKEKVYEKYFVSKGTKIQTSSHGLITLEYDGVIMSNSDYLEEVGD